MQALEEISIFLCLGDHIYGFRGGVDHRSTGDSNLGDQVAAAYIAARNRRYAICWIDETLLPQDGPAVGIECKNAVMFGRDIEHIVRTAGNVLHPRQVKGLRIYIPAVQRGRK